MRTESHWGMVFALLAAGLAAMPSTVQAAGEWPDLAKPSAEQGGGENDAGLIIGIENYTFVSDVRGAAKNADDWYGYLLRTRKIPIRRLRLLRDNEASVEAIREAATEIAGLAKPGGTLWLVFIGHGAPGANGKDGVLVGVDAQQTASSLYSRSIGHSELLKAFEGGKAAHTVVVMDACFSGKTGEGGALLKDLQPMIPVFKSTVGASTVVLTAAKGDQFAGPLPGLKRPAFSYLVLGALRGWGDANKDGRVTAAEARDFADEALWVLVKDRRQNPEIRGETERVLAAGAREGAPDLAALALKAPTSSMGGDGRRADSGAAPPGGSPAAPALGSGRAPVPATHRSERGLIASFYNLPPGSTMSSIAGRSSTTSMTTVDLEHPYHDQGAPAAGVSADWFGVVYRGELRIESAGTYAFQLSTCGVAAMLTVGNNSVRAAGCENVRHGQWWFEKGWVSVELTVFQGDDLGAGWKVRWRRPGDGAFSPLSANLLRTAE